MGDGGVTCHIPNKVYSMITLLFGLVNKGTMTVTIGTILGSIRFINNLLAWTMSLMLRANLELTSNEMSNVRIVSAIVSLGMEMFPLKLLRLNGGKVNDGKSNRNWLSFPTDAVDPDSDLKTRLKTTEENNWTHLDQNFVARWTLKSK